jgi:hypothetical protein
MSNEATPMTTNPTPLPPEGVTLKPCPLCGGAPKLNGNLARGAFGVVCGNKHHVQTYGATSAEAITAWNTRIAATSAAEGEVEALKAEIEEYRRRNFTGLANAAIATARAARDEAQARATKTEAANARLTEALEKALKPYAQFRSDLASAHAEICKLQGLDPEAHSWPEWSPQANTLRWLDALERSARQALDQGAEG